MIFFLSARIHFFADGELEAHIYVSRTFVISLLDITETQGKQMEEKVVKLVTMIFHKFVPQNEKVIDNIQSKIFIFLIENFP